MKAQVNKFSKNAKLNSVLTGIYEQLKDFGEDEIKHYKKEFTKEKDFNLVQYGNILIYYDQVREFYKSCGYACDRWSNEKLWETYKRQVGYIARTRF